MAFDPNVLKTYLPTKEEIIPNLLGRVKAGVGQQLDEIGTTVPNILQSPDTENINDSIPEQESKYSFDNLTYPLDLFGEESKYGNLYVVFYINIQEDSRLAQQNAGRQDFFVEDDTEKGKGSSITRNKVSSGQAAGSLGAAGLISGSVVGRIFGLSGAGGVIGAIGGAAVGAGSGLIKSGVYSEQEKNNDNPKSITNINLTKQTKRLKSAIALYAPNELNFRYGIQWGDDSTSSLQTILEGGSDLGEALSQFAKNDFSSVENLSSNAVLQGAILRAAQAASPEGLSALTGTAPNPRKEQQMSGVDFRTHQFFFRFWARNEAEHNMIKNIIKEFKYHMHPEFKDGNEYIFLYPSEFDIQFYYKDAESTELPRYTTCVLSDLSTNYTPQAVMSLIKNGKPAEITMTLTFRELAILTKEDIEVGY